MSYKVRIDSFEGYVFNFNPFSWYLGVTAGNLFDFMFPPFFS